MELREPAGCVLECVKPRKQHVRSDKDTPGAAETGSRQSSAQTWAKASARTGIADSVAHELSHPAIAALAERTPIRRI